MATLEIKNVTKSFAKLEVLKSVNLEVEDGDFLVLVGPSGCGKSTLLNIIAGLLDLTKGSILIDGKAIEQLEPKERDIAMVFQSYALYPSMTVGENIAFSLKMRRVPKKARDEKVREVGELLQIQHLMKRRPHALSGGQRQRVAMGRALVRNPKVFLFDEPLSNLDAKLRVDMRTEIKRLHQRLKTTIVYVTHDQVEAMTMATKIAVMKDGMVQQFGTPDEIYEQPSNTFVATFMGSPAMNLLSGRVSNSGKSIELDGGVELPLGDDRPALTAGKKVHLGVRPEWFAPVPDGTPGDGTVSATVEVIEPTGPDLYADLMLGETEVIARLPAKTPLELGKTMRFRIELDRTVLFDVDTGDALEG